MIMIIMMQYYSESYPQRCSDSKTGGIETQKFFLNCLCLLLGRFEGKKFECILSEYGMKLVPCLLHQVSFTIFYEIGSDDTLYMNFS